MANHQDKRGRPSARTDAQLVPPSENRLKRETPYVCNVRFHADLPEVPCDPKMLVAPLQPEKLAAFSLTTLERNPRRDLVQEADLGIHISLLDTERFSVPDVVPPLAPEDAALLVDDAEPAAAAAAATPASAGPASAKTRERARGARAEVSWLMRTTYIANDTAERRAQQGAPDRRGRAEPGEAAAYDERDARAAHCAAVEESFEAMQRAPVHPRNPELAPVAVLPVLPDEVHGAYNYVQATFDSDPTADHERLNRMPAEQRQRIAERAAIKSYSLRKQDGSIDQFAAYLLPLDPPRGAGEAGPSREADEVALEWVREYTFSVNNPHDPAARNTFWFLFGDGRVTYNDLNTRLEVKKRARRSESDFQRPAQIKLMRLQPGEAADELAAANGDEGADLARARSPAAGAEQPAAAGGSPGGWLAEPAYSD